MVKISYKSNGEIMIHIKRLIIPMYVYNAKIMCNFSYFSCIVIQHNDNNYLGAWMIRQFLQHRIILIWSYNNRFARALAENNHNTRYNEINMFSTAINEHITIRNCCYASLMR